MQLILASHLKIQTTDVSNISTCHRTLFSDYSVQSLTKLIHQKKIFDQYQNGASLSSTALYKNYQMFFYYSQMNNAINVRRQIINLTKVTICLLSSCNTEKRIAQNIYIQNSNKNYTKLTTTTILIKKRIGIGYKNYRKQCPGLEFRLIPKLISWAGLKPKKFKKISLS